MSEIDFDIEAAISKAMQELEAKGFKMEGLTLETLRDALKHPLAREVYAQQIERELASVQQGQPAPDFSLSRLEMGRQEERVRLSDCFANRPVALIFGSYT